MQAKSQPRFSTLTTHKGSVVFLFMNEFEPPKTIETQATIPEKKKPSVASIVTWGIFAILGTMCGGGLMLATMDVPQSGDASSRMAYVIGYAMGGFGFPLVLALPVFIFKRFRNLRAYFKTVCVIAGLVILSAASRSGQKANEGDQIKLRNEQIKRGIEERLKKKQNQGGE